MVKGHCDLTEDELNVLHSALEVYIQDLNDHSRLFKTPDDIGMLEFLLNEATTLRYKFAKCLNEDG